MHRTPCAFIRQLHRHLSSHDEAKERWESSKYTFYLTSPRPRFPLSPAESDWTGGGSIADAAPNAGKDRRHFPSAPLFSFAFRCCKHAVPGDGQAQGSPYLCVLCTIVCQVASDSVFYQEVEAGWRRASLVPRHVGLSDAPEMPPRGMPQAAWLRTKLTYWVGDGYFRCGCTYAACSKLQTSPLSTPLFRCSGRPDEPVPGLVGAPRSVSPVFASVSHLAGGHRLREFGAQTSASQHGNNWQWESRW